MWPTIAEISLLAALGCGDWMLSVVLEELARDDRYEFCVVCATPGAATFYERHGFVRVGAIARYVGRAANISSDESRGGSVETSRGAAAAATWIYQRRRVAAPPRVPRGSSVETRNAAAGTQTHER